MKNTLQNHEVRLVARPEGRSKPEHFVYQQAPMPAIDEGEVLVRVDWLSIDPYLNERALNNKMGPIIPLGSVMPGRGIGTVLSGDLPAGTLVAGEFGWQNYASVAARQLSILPQADNFKPTWALSILGMPGISAWLALNRIFEIKDQQTLLISSAAGTVGSILLQLAKLLGLSVIGISSNTNKCAWLEQAGCDYTIDRSQIKNWPDAIKKVAGNGIDLYFDNVGGSLLEAVLKQMNPQGQIILCGHTAEYLEPPAHLLASTILYQRLKLQGFLVWDYMDEFDNARNALLRLAQAAQLSVPETIYENLDQAPAALDALLQGKGHGKLLVQL